MQAKLLFAALLATITVLPTYAQYDARSAGLPPVRNSAYMGTPGDAIRSDLGNNISGNHQVRRNTVQRVGLPQCRNSAYMGQPGDGIRSDLGNNIAGSRAMQPSAQRVGLPQCRNSAYMGQPGDGIRSDLGKHISGHTVRNQQPVYHVQQSGPSMVPAYGYADYK